MWHSREANLPKKTQLKLSAFINVSQCWISSGDGSLSFKKWYAGKMHYFQEYQSGLMQVCTEKIQNSLVIYADFRVSPICTAV